MAIDLGTANTVIFKDDQVVLDEPSIIATDTKTGKLMALGTQAQLMEEHTPPGITTIRPLMNGVIADYDAAEMMLTGFIRKATGRKKSILAPALRVVIGIPGGSTPVDMRSIRDSASHAGAHDVEMIYEPMASALGIGLDVTAPNGNMIVDIGGGTTEIAVISLGGIVESASIHIAGNEITSDIIDHMAQQHNIHIGRTTADQIKFAVGSVLPELDEAEVPEPIVVTGRNMVTGLPLEAAIDYREISMCIDKTVAKIENEILKVLQRTPPELYSNIVRNGVWLAGGGSLLRGIAKRFAAKVNIDFHVAEDPLKAVARGTCLALKGSDRYPFMMK
ncbi:MAG: rod shape-determining protein [Candidatus Methanomethylophilaceae archaeon]|nr:rod shape-determining protein [Candidatus Methanomethylophilaceae archaeon]